jgi:transcriptional regulator with XRE-family HTH domain
MQIRQLREQKGITQKKLAELSGITPAYLCDLEKGGKRNPSIDVLMRLANSLGVSIDTLLGKKAG